MSDPVVIPAAENSTGDPRLLIVEWTFDGLYVQVMVDGETHGLHLDREGVDELREAIA